MSNIIAVPESYVWSLYNNMYTYQDIARSNNWETLKEGMEQKPITDQTERRKDCS